MGCGSSSGNNNEIDQPSKGKKSKNSKEDDLLGNTVPLQFIDADGKVRKSEAMIDPNHIQANI